MTSRVVHRPARTVRPPSDEEPLTVAAPPTLPEGKSGSGGMAMMLPMGGAAVAMSMMMFFRGSGFAALGALVMVVVVVGYGVFYLSQRGQSGRKRRQARERYLGYLERLREDLRADEQKRQARARQTAPPCGHLLDLVRDPARRWERRRSDPDFLRVRLGTGTLSARELALRGEDNPTAPADEFMKAEATALVRRFAETPEMPLPVDLDRAGEVSLIAGDHETALSVARAVVTQVAACHAPDDAPIAIVAPPEAEPEWAWARWLPHLLDRELVTGAGAQPLMAPDADHLAVLLERDLGERTRQAAQSYRHGAGSAEAAVRKRLLVIDDCYGRTARTLPLPDRGSSLAALGITVVHLLDDRLAEPEEISSRITVADDAITVEGPSGQIQGVPEVVGRPWAEGLARELAPLRLAADSFDDGTGSAPADFTGLLGFADPRHLDLAELWRPRGQRDFLRIPIGVSDAGRPVLLDLKESAQLGMGPHGLCVGATGSGKSELLRDLVLALAATHPPERVAMMLVDYKGGATFAPFAELPHVAGLLTNLAADASLVERMYTSLDGEVLRRQQVLADAGKLTDIVEYNLHREQLGCPTDMPPMGNLVVIIDEFGELLTAKPDFIELFLRIGRIGRSIGIHLLLSSQRLEEGKLRGLDSYLSYRIGLRTLSEMESRTVLDNTDAFHLPPLPGLGYLKVDVSIYERFKSAYISGPLRDRDGDETPADEEPTVLELPRYGHPPGELESGPEPAAATERTTGESLMSTVASQLSAVDPARQVAPIWLAPLPPSVTLDRACGGFDVTPQGLRLRSGRDEAGLTAPLGLLDDPAGQWQGTWTVDLSGAGGNLLVLGGPAAGKSTTLRTLALGLAGAYSPTEVGIYAVDLHGNDLRSLDGLPHVGGIAGRDDLERVRRTFDELAAMLSHRERLFASNRIDSAEDLREARAAGRLPELASTEVVLLLDGYAALASEFEHLEERVADLLSRGSRYGIHMVAAARRWGEVRNAQQVAFGERIELRLTDPGESAIDGKTARLITGERPGRAITTGKLVGQVALPRLDGTPNVAGGLAEAAELIRNTWTGPLAAPVRVLPPLLHATDLAEASTEPGTVAVGRFERDFSPVLLDLFKHDQHLLVLGDTDTGKTNLCALLAAGLHQHLSEEELVFAVFDPRHGLAEAVPEPHLGGYAPNPTLAAKLAQAVAAQLAERAEGDAKAKQSGPRIVLLIDDYDILAASGTQPLAPLVPYLAAGRDVGLHAVLTRRVMGASRGLYEPFTTGVRDSGCLALVMSGDRSEGQLFPGVRPTVLPAGRAQLVRPGELARHIQTAYLDAAEQP
jgi:S-DNA-T family DNA segregation ATPase FtsK/SpoIIIE